MEAKGRGEGEKRKSGFGLAPRVFKNKQIRLAIEKNGRKREKGKEEVGRRKVRKEIKFRRLLTGLDTTLMQHATLS